MRMRCEDGWAGRRRRRLIWATRRRPRCSTVAHQVNCMILGRGQVCGRVPGLTQYCLCIRLVRSHHCTHAQLFTTLHANTSPHPTARTPLHHCMRTLLLKTLGAGGTGFGGEYDDLDDDAAAEAAGYGRGGLGTLDGQNRFMLIGANESNYSDAGISSPEISRAASPERRPGLSRALSPIPPAPGPPAIMMTNTTPYHTDDRAATAYSEPMLHGWASVQARTPTFYKGSPPREAQLTKRRGMASHHSPPRPSAPPPNTPASTRLWTAGSKGFPSSPPPNTPSSTRLWTAGSKGFPSSPYLSPEKRPGQRFASSPGLSRTGASPPLTRAVSPDKRAAGLSRAASPDRQRRGASRAGARPARPSEWINPLLQFAGPPQMPFGPSVEYAHSAPHHCARAVLGSAALARTVFGSAALVRTRSLAHPAPVHSRHCIHAPFSLCAMAYVCELLHRYVHSAPPPSRPTNIMAITGVDLASVPASPCRLPPQPLSPPGLGSDGHGHDATISRVAGGGGHGVGRPGGMLGMSAPFRYPDQHQLSGHVSLERGWTGIP